MLPLNVSAASGLNTTWKDTLLRAPMDKGIAEETTMNSGRLLVICWIEVAWRLLLVTTIVAAVLVVPMVTDPKLSAEGETPTPACAGTGNKTEPTKNNPMNKHTSRVLTICGQPFVNNFVSAAGTERVGVAFRSSCYLLAERE